MQPQPQEFEIVLSHYGDGSYGFFMPFDAGAAFGKRDRIRVRGTIDGMPYRGTLTPSNGRYFMAVNRAMRFAIGKSSGDMLKVVVKLDTEPRVVELPEDLIWTLDANANAKAIFDKFGNSHRREYVNWIESARKAEIRARRVQEAVQRIVAEKQGA